MGALATAPPIAFEASGETLAVTVNLDKAIPNGRKSSSDPSFRVIYLEPAHRHQLGEDQLIVMALGGASARFQRGNCPEVVQYRQEVKVVHDFVLQTKRQQFDKWQDSERSILPVAT